MDYHVELVLLDIALQYNAVARGDLDLMLMAWLPNTHADYWTRVKNKVEDLGVLYEGARLGWVVPNYTQKAVLRSIADLKKPDVIRRLRGRIHGIDPGAGLMRLSKETIKAYGLDHYDLLASSGAGMTVALKRAVRRQKWIVVTGWRPHWMFGAFDLRFLEDPKGSLGGEESIHAIGRKGLAADHPKVAAFISRMRIPLDALERLMYAGEQTSYEDAAARFVQTHAKQVDYWLAGTKQGLKTD
jgi:glycine betaine/proline transport system substrate-binding protein